jgi:transposase
MKDMHVFEREVNGRRYRVAAQSVWDPVRSRSVARQTVLGPATAPPVADLGATRTVGTKAVGDVGALIWVAEQLDLIGHIDRACGNLGAKGGPSVGELAVAVAIQRACSPGPKRDLAEFLDGAVPRLSCLPASAFTGQVYHRVAQQITDEQLEQAQIAIAKAAVARFELSADVLAFDTTNFDTHIATVTPGELARRGHAKSKRRDLRVVGLGVLVSETGHVPLLYRTYSGNSSDQAVLTACLDGLRALHQSLDEGECRERAQRTLVRDGGFWSPQLELDLDVVGYYSLISLPLGHAAAERALQMAAKRGAMKPLTGKLAQVRAARVQAKVGNLDRTLVVVESQELLEGQKRGIAVALRKAKAELSKLDRLVRAKRISRSSLEQRIKKTLGREHLSSFVVAEIGGDDDRQPTLRWHVDAALRRQLEKTRLGRRVLCTDHHLWSTGRIVQAFRGQWNVEELFRRAKKGGVVPWGPSHQWADGSIRLHTFATVLGLMLVSLAKIALGTANSARAMMGDLSEIRATLVRTTTGGPGRRATVMIAPELTISQRRAVTAFELDRWMPTLLSCMTTRPVPI